MTEYDIALIGVCGPILGVLIGSILTYRFSKDLAHKAAVAQNFITACDKFKEKWLPVYINIQAATQKTNLGNPNFAIEFAQKIRENNDLRASTIIFGRRLKGKNREKFDALCETFFGIDEGKNWKEHTYPKFYSETNDSKEIEARKNLLEHIDQLLSFAEK